MADMIYRLILKASFENKEELERAIAGLEKVGIAGGKVGISVGKGTTEAGVSLEGIGRNVMRMGFMFNMLESAYMRQTMASMLATNAQERYNTVVARYGKNSEEAKQSAKELASQMDYLNSANMRANVTTGLMITQFALSTGLLEKETLATIKATTAKWAHAAALGFEGTLIKGSIINLIAHQAATIAATIVDWAHVAALKAKAVLLAMVSYGTLVPAMAVAGAATAAVIAGVLGTRATGGYIPETGNYLLHKGEYVLPTTNMPTATITPSTQYNFETHLHIEEESLDAALEEQKRRILAEWRRFKG